jgi:pyridoxine kinase
VGNKSAVFPLQLLGIEVDAINTVHFSNHTGYASFAGKVLGAEELWQLIEGLEKNELLQYTHLLTGYMGSAALCRVIVRIAQKLKQLNPSLVYVCDPVLGDNGKLYVPEELVGIYRSEVMPVADIITPNQFEVEQLRGTGSIATQADLFREIAPFHAAGVHTVIVTSFEATFDTVREGMIGVLGSFNSGGRRGSGGDAYTFVLSIPSIAGHYTGTGDLFAALFLAWVRHTPTQPHLAAERVAATMQSVISRTLQAAAGGVGSKATELKLIQSKNDIEVPIVIHRALCSGCGAGAGAGAAGAGAGAGAGVGVGASPRSSERPTTANPDWWG